MTVKGNGARPNLPSREELKELRSLLRESQEMQTQLRFMEKEETHGGSGTFYKKEVERNLVRCTVLAGVLQHFINEIEDSVTRRIFTFYYVYGWSWQKIAFQIGSQNEATPRIIHARYLEKLEREAAVTGENTDDALCRVSVD